MIVRCRNRNSDGVNVFRIAHCKTLRTIDSDSFLISFSGKLFAGNAFGKISQRMMPSGLPKSSCELIYVSAIAFLFCFRAVHFRILSISPEFIIRHTSSAIIGGTEIFRLYNASDIFCLYVPEQQEMLIKPGRNYFGQTGNIDNLFGRITCYRTKWLF